MSLHRKSILLVMTTVAATLPASVALAPAAFAGCPTETYYSTYNRALGYTPTSAKSYQVAGPATIDYTVSQSSSHSFGISASFSVSSSAIIAKAEATAGVDYNYTTEKTTSWGYHTSIPAGKTGIMQVLHQADRWSVTKYVDNADCTTTTYTNAVATIPKATTVNTSYCIIRDFTPYRTGWQSTCAGE